VNRKKLGRRIRRAREAKGWTQWQLADELGLSQPTISDWEAGAIAPSFDNLPKLAKALDTTVSDLVDPPKKAAG